MDAVVQTKKRYHILFFILKKNEGTEINTDTPVKKNKPRRWSRHLVALFTVLVFIFFIYPRDKLFNDISQLSNYISTNWNFSTPEVRHIGFLKVHKAGGSTLQNMIFRFGMRRNLSFVIPLKSYKLSEYGSTPNTILSNRNGPFYDILALHSVYNETVYSKLLPNDTMHIAIIRQPLELTISGAYYHRDVWKMSYLEKVPKQNYIRNLILFPELYDQEEFSWTRNSMAMDFGFPKGLHSTETDTIQKYLTYLNKTFHLVLVMEYFDESLILLRRLARWKLKDILYIPQNTFKHPTLKELNLTASDIGKFELRNFLDVAIYTFFSDIFKEKITTAGDDFPDEVKHFKRVVSKVRDYCVFSERHSMESELTVLGSEWNEEFSVTSLDCEDMMTPELKFIDKIRDRMKSNMRGVANKFWTP